VVTVGIVHHCTNFSTLRQFLLNSSATITLVELPNCFFDLDSAALASVSGLFGRGGTYRKKQKLTK
jgi:hypothetical protein